MIKTNNKNIAFIWRGSLPYVFYSRLLLQLASKTHALGSRDNDLNLYYGRRQYLYTWRHSEVKLCNLMFSSLVKSLLCTTMKANDNYA